MLLLQINDPHTRFSRFLYRNDRKSVSGNTNMKNINKIIRMASVGAALAVVFTIAFATPAFAHAQYSSYGSGNYGGNNYGGNSYNNNCNYGCHSYSTPSYSVSNSGYNYSYGRPAPIVITQPPQIVYQQPQVVVQQPQVIYQQPQPIVYQQPQPIVYQQPTYYPITVSCSANPTSVSTGQSVTWQAYVSGGSNSYNNYNNNTYNNSGSYNNGSYYNSNNSYNSGSYTYTWTGTNGSYSSGPTAYSTYNTPGSYPASVTVYANGQSVTQSCGYVTVTGSYAYNYTPTYAYNYPTTYTTVTPNTNGNLVAACFADKTTASIGTPVTWSVEVTGGTGQYTYSWSGSDSLAGTGASATQSYSTAGQKNATVLINSNGQTISQACGDSVNVRAYVSPATTNYQGPAVTPTPTTANPNSLSAAAFLGLGYIPWGWIAILIIIILGVSVFYLIFNRHNKEV
jgi:hypothetical protein